MIPRDPLVALDRAVTPHVLNREILSNRPRAISHERVRCGETVTRQERVEEVVERFVEHARRSNVRGERLIVSRRRSMERFDRPRRVDARRPGILMTWFIPVSLDESSW